MTTCQWTRHPACTADAIGYRTAADHRGDVPICFDHENTARELDGDPTLFTPLSAAARTSRDMACPACFAPVDARCSAPTDDSRRDVNWFHTSRIMAALNWNYEHHVKAAK